MANRAQETATELLRVFAMFKFTPGKVIKTSFADLVAKMFGVNKEHIPEGIQYLLDNDLLVREGGIDVSLTELGYQRIQETSSTAGDSLPPSPSSAAIDAIVARRQMFERFLASPIGQHLRDAVDSAVTEASGGQLLNAQSIKEEIHEYAPSALVFPFGFLPIWASIGGNVVVYSLNDGCFYWCDHEGFSTDGNMFLYGSLKEVKYTPENITQGMLKLSGDSVEKFLADIRSGAYEEQLGKLD